MYKKDKILPFQKSVYGIFNGSLSMKIVHFDTVNAHMSKFKSHFTTTYFSVVDLRKSKKSLP